MNIGLIRTLMVCIPVVLSAAAGTAFAAPGDGSIIGTTKIVDNGSAADRFNIVLLGDGYQESELDTYAAHVQQFVDFFKDTPPFDTNCTAFNVYRVDVASDGSGADDPAAPADDPNTPADESLNCSGGTGAATATYFDATFCSDGVIRRLLGVNAATAVAVLNAEVPEWNFALVIVNSSIYGGSGGSVGTTSVNGDWENIAIHEMGHAAFGLADEYEYYAGCGTDTDRDNHPAVEPAEANVTIETDRDLVKWSELILPATPILTTNNADCTLCDPQGNPFPGQTVVGLYEGAHYYHCDSYRPVFSCMMRNFAAFCPVCTRRILDVLDPYLSDEVLTIPGGVYFDDTCVGDTSTETLYACNTGSENLEVSGVASSDPQFLVVVPSSGYPVVVSPDFCFPFQARFTPGGAGPASATFTVSTTSADPICSAEVQAAGEGIVSNLVTVIADNGDFGDVCRGEFGYLDLILSNSGGCDLEITNITSSSANFAVSDVVVFPLVVGPGGFIFVPIRFAPTTLGVKNGMITIVSNDPPNRQVAVRGNVPPGDIRVTGSTDFGDVCAGAQATEDVSVCNVGECNLNVSSVAFVGACPDFTLVNNPFPAPVSPDSCESVTIRFTPTTCGAKSCTLQISSDDPDAPTVDLTLTANTPCNDIDVSPDQCFAQTVIQSVGACKSLVPFPISNKGSCPIVIPSIALSGADSGAYLFSGLPSFPINLQPGHVVGDGAFQIGFAPLGLARDTLASIDVTYEIDPVTHSTTTVTRTLNGEGVRTGARVLVTHNNVAIPLVSKVMIQRITGNRNKPNVDTVDNARDLQPITITPAVPCGSFQYHKEYGTVSNSIQLLPGSYQITASAFVNNKKLTKTIGFDVSTCTFNANIVIELP